VGPVSVLICAIGGYGYYYLKTLLEEIPESKAIICGVVDPLAENSILYNEIVRRKVPVYNNIEDFYNKGKKADLVVISSPIHYHVRQALVALENDSHVLCDKPAGSTVQEVNKLIIARNKYGKTVNIGYQWSYTNAIQQLKKDILANKFGEPVLLKSLCFWPRGYDYYQRNEWAGRIISDDDWIIDHPANNAFAHFIHNMLFLIGDDLSASASPASVAGELYKAYDIENGDTVACKILTNKGVPLLFYGSHVTEKEHEPVFEFEFKNARILLNKKTRDINAVLKDGSSINYGSPDKEHQFLKLFEAIDSVKNNNKPVCSLEAAIPQTICANGIQDSSTEISVFSNNLIINEKDRKWIRGLGENLLTCYNKGILPAESEFTWARKAVPINLLNYNYYPGGIKN